MSLFNRYQAFKNDLSNGLIKIKSLLLKKNFDSFSFIYLNRENFEDEIRNIKENNLKLIIIDQYTENEMKYNIICFFETLLIIDQNDMFLLKSFFIQEKDSTLFCLQDQINQEITELLNLNQNLNFCQPNDLQNLKIEICSFFTETSSLFITKNKEVFSIIKIILKPIIGFLIRKSYLKTNFNRIQNINEMFNPAKTKENDANNLIKLRQFPFGSNSVSSLVFDQKKEELFVLKTFNLYFSESEKLFNREMTDLLSIHHPFLVKFYGTLSNNDHKSLFIEFINGDALKSIQKTKYNEMAKIKIILSILFVIQYLHFQNFIYRDLKPNNLMIDKNGDFVLIDFDRMIKNIKENTGFQSTHDFGHLYAAPELNILSVITEKVDIYSLGLIIYFIINEKDPIKNQNKISLNDIQPKYIKLKEICEKCINEKPEERPTISEIIHDFIFCFLTDIYKDSSYLKTENCFVNILEKNIEFSENGCNDSEALYTLGLLYLKGIFIEKNVMKAFDYFVLASELNHPKAQVEVGIIYSNGFGDIKQDFDSAILYFNLAAIQIYSYGFFYLGSIQFFENYQQKDINVGIHYYELAANLNNSEALLNLGLLYLENKIIKQDVQKAIKCLTQAANQGQVNAQYNLGILYIDGLGVVQDIGKGIHYLLLASKQRFIKARFKLGVIFFEGKIVQRDVNKAIDFLIFASNRNYLDAQFYLGCIYYEGKYVKRDYNEAIKYFTLAANQKDSNALGKLGIIYYNGEGVEKDINKSIHYFSLSMMENNISSVVLLCNIYENEYFHHDYFTKRKKRYLYAVREYNTIYFSFKFHKEFIEYDNYLPAENIDAAIDFLTQKSDNNDLSAKFALGLIYFEEIFIESDIEKALKYLTDAAEMNFAKAQYILGIIYFLGKNVEKNIEKTIYYWSKAGKFNNFEALFGLISIYSNRNDITKVYEIINQIAHQKDLQSIYKAAIICYKGKIIKKDINKAIELFTIAADQNHSESALNLFILYYEGKEIKNDYSKAIRYYFIALRNNKNANILNYLVNPKNIQNFIKYFDQFIRQYNYYPYIYFAEFYIRGIYFRHDMNKALQCLEYSKSLVKGVQYIAGMIYYEGKLVTRNIRKARFYFAEGANFNDKNCCYQFANILFEGKDINRYIDYFLRSINPYFDMLPFNLVRQDFNSYSGRDLIYEFEMMNKNLFLDKNMNKLEIKNVVYYFMNKSFENDSMAQFMIGLLYYKGVYFNKDVNKAKKFFYLSAIQNNPNSQLILGIILIEKQIEKAIHFLLQTKLPKKSDALFILGSLYYEGKYVEKNIKKAISFFKDASNLNNSHAKNNLGIIYLKGINVQKNVVMAIEYFKEAIKINQDDLALFNLAHLYLFENNMEIELKKIVDLLIKPINNNLICAIQLLNYAIVKQFLGLEFTTIKNELEKINIKLSSKIFQAVINQSRFESNQSMYNFIKNASLFYIYYDGCILPFVENEEIRERQIRKKIPKKTCINQSFYDGFNL